MLSNTLTVMQDNYNLILKHLKSESKIIIVDEVDYLIGNKHVIEILRDIQDNTGTPIVLVGMGFVDKKQSSEENPLIFVLRKLYYAMLSKMSDNGVELVQNSTGSGLYDKKIVDFIRTVDDTIPFFRGLVCEAGFKRDYVEFSQPVRKRGKSKNNLYTLYDLGMNGIVKYTRIPLRIMAITGFIMSLLSLLGAFVYFVWKLLNWNSFSIGIAPIIICILFLGSVQLFCLGILGEYIGIIYSRVDRKPIVIEKGRINF